MPTITIKGVAGLGNRLFTLANALEIAHRRKICVHVDWSDGQIFPRGSDAFSPYFSAPHAIGTTSDWGLYDYFEEATNIKPMLKYSHKLGICSSSSIWRRKDCIENKTMNLPGILIPPELCLRKNRIYYADFLPFRESRFIKQISIHEEVKTKFLKKLPDNITKMTGIHVRNSDKKPPRNMEEFFKSLPKDKAYFLATDSEEVIDLCQRFKLKIHFLDTVRLSKTHKTELGGLHHLQLSRDDKKSQFEDALVDLIGLVQCETFIGQSNSSFSRVVKAWRNPELSSWYWV